MADHTLGRWVIDYNDGGYPKVRPELEPGYMICSVITNINMPWEEVQANCRLIAAAPEMHAILADIRELLIAYADKPEAVYRGEIEWRIEQVIGPRGVPDE